MCVYSLKISNTRWACSILYRHLWPVRLYHIFPHYLINGIIFEKEKFLNIKCVFWFSLQILSETFLTLKKHWATCDQYCTLLLTWSTHHYCQIWIKSEFSRQVFLKTRRSKFHENPSSESRTVPCGRTHIQTDKKLIVAFLNSSNAHKTIRTDRGKYC